MRGRVCGLHWAAGCAAFLGLVLLVTTPALPAQAAPDTDFYSGFELGDPQPTWQNTAETDPLGDAMVSGVSGSSAALGSGQAFNGSSAITFAGSQTAAGRGYAYSKVFAVNVSVTQASQLSYLLFPVRQPAALSNPSTFVSVDLHFTDGTYLSQLGAQDQYFANVDPQEMGASKTLVPDAWNHIVSTIGAVAVGKTIDRILVAYDNPNGSADPGSPPAAYADWVDDITITGNPDQTPSNPVVYTPARPSDYVLTTRGMVIDGGGRRGGSFPATAVPNGFNFWTPKGLGPGEPFSYDITGFECNHEENDNLGSNAVFSLMPSPGPILPSNGGSLSFSHVHEIAKAHYYSVTFDNGMQTEITPTDHAAMFRFTFTGNTSTVTFQINAADLSIQGSGVVTGTGGGSFFHGTFDAPITASKDSTVQFDTSVNKVVTLKIATSYISVAQAAHNLGLEISPSDTFDSVEARAQTLWDQRLGAITVQGANNEQLTTMYSNLYRTNLYPNHMHENAGTAAHPANVYHSYMTGNTVQGQIDVGGGFWDSYHSLWPLYTLLYPTVTGHLIDGFVQQYKETGSVPQWSTPTGNYLNMTGTNSDVAFADAYIKGVTNFDVTAAYDAALRNATVARVADQIARDQGQAANGRHQLNTSIFLGYTPPQYGSIDWTQENSINDFGIANMAKALYQSSNASDPRRQQYLDEYQYFLSNSLDYANLFDPAIGFFQEQSSPGQWALTPQQFSPFGYMGPYTEANAWGFAFNVPHDGQGLANLYGGKAQLAAKLDQLFSTPEPGDGAVVESYENMVAGFGQWQIANQPAFPAPYMYDYAGEPYKAQAILRVAQKRLYVGGDIGQGWIGDDDGGAMAAYQVFGALGFYPLQMGAPYYVIGSPSYKQATVHLENGKHIVINAPNNSPTNVYIQGLTLNGKPYTKTYLSQADLAKGAVLDFVMGPTPSMWGTGPDDAPLSITVGNAAPAPIHDLTGPGLGSATASGNTDPSALFDNTSDTQVTLNSQTPRVQYQLAGPPQTATFYTLTSSAHAGGDPSSWALQGSNDGLQWTTLDQRQSATFMSRRQTRPFMIASPGSYSYYRLDVTQTTGLAPTTLAEMEFLVGGITSFDGEGAGSIEAPATPATGPAGSAGSGSAGSGSAGRPASLGAPSISGSTVQGMTLAEAHGSWTASPTSYTYQWKRCDTAGKSCQAIVGAKAQTYTLTAADVGFTVRAEETASNAAGAGLPVDSSPTVVITPPTAVITPAAPGSVSAAQVLSSLKRQIVPSGNAKIAGLLKSGAYKVAFKALEAGAVVVGWYAVPSRVSLSATTTAKPVLVAVGRQAFSKAGTGTLRIKLTTAGKRLFKHALAKKTKRLTLTAKATFTPTGKPAIRTTKTFVLGR